MDNNKILLVDDSVDNLKLMVSVFEKYEPTFEIFQTNNPKKAIVIAKQTFPNLIITDWNMPELSGIDLIKMFKTENVLKDIPIIMATGVMLTAEDLKTALNEGAVDYIRKPIEPVELIARSKSSLLLANYYKQLVDQKNKELTENSLYLVKGQEFNRSVASTIDSIKEQVVKNTPKALNELDQLKKELQQQINEDGWLRFNLSFSNVHSSFNQNLTTKHPNLSPAELKLCSFIKLGMPNKEIAAVINQSTDSIKTTRYRIRKKLKLEGVNLESYISGF